MGRTIKQSIGALILFTCIALSPQQERQYTISIPARLVNAHLMLVQGQWDQLTAQDLRDLQIAEVPQIYAQYRQYAYVDSVAQARQRAVKDTSKTRKP